MNESPELRHLARQLGVRIVAPLGGGEFGAMLAIDGDGRELVLKAMSLPAVFSAAGLAAWFERGARLSARLRAEGYPAPEYFGTGATEHFAWSLQERLPGEVPDVMTPAHARRLVELAAMHCGAAGESYDWRSWALRRMEEWLPGIVANDEASSLAHELAEVFDRLEDVVLLEDSIVHADFHHRNYLAIGDEVTAVFDWEMALPGDWRVDLVTLAFWAAIHEQVPDDAARIIVGAAKASCPPDVLAFLAAFRAVSQLDFDVRVRPERVTGIVQAIDMSVAPWWRRA